MNEQEWLASADPGAMLEWVRLGNVAADDDYPPNYPHCPVRVSDRKLRLFVCACCRAVWHLLTDPRSRRAVETAERYADGLVTEEELSDARNKETIVLGWWVAQYAASAPDGLEENVRLLVQGVSYPGHRTPEQFPPPAPQAALLRDLVGNPWRPVVLPRAEFPCPDCTPGEPDDNCDDCGGSGVADGPCPWLTPLVVQLARAAYEERDGTGLLAADRLAVLADALEEAGCTDADLIAHLRGDGPHVHGCHALDALLGRS